MPHYAMFTLYYTSQRDAAFECLRLSARAFRYDGMPHAIYIFRRSILLSWRSHDYDGRAGRGTPAQAEP